MHGVFWIKSRTDMVQVVMQTLSISGGINPERKWKMWPCPADTLRNNDVVITSKRRHFDVITSKWRRLDVITTLLLRHVFSGCHRVHSTTHPPNIWHNHLIKPHLHWILLTLNSNYTCHTFFMFLIQIDTSLLDDLLFDWHQSKTQK